MKKFMIKIAIVLLICLSAGVSHAYMFNDTIGDRLGDPPFELYGMDVTQTGNSVVFDIFTNYKDNYTVGGWTTLSADFAINIDSDSDYEYGVAFRNHTSTDNPLIKEGDFYLIDTSLIDTGDIVNGWYITDHYEPAGGGYGYWHGKPVGIAGGSLVKNVAVTWNPIGSNPNYRISFTLDKNDFLLNNEETFSFFTASATCANDYMGGTVKVVPEPASMILFGIGVFGFGVIKRRRFLIHGRK